MRWLSVELEKLVWCNLVMAPHLQRYEFILKKIVMRLQEFNTLSLTNQIKTVFNKGAYIADRLEQEFTVVLYTLGRFCVEVYYHEADSEPVSLRSFNCPEKLEPYLDEVNLASIV